MLARIIVFFILLVAIFSFVVHFYGGKSLPHSNPWFDVVIAIEEYLYEKENVDVIIVGSSLSKTLPSSLLSENAFNLSLAGLNAFTGLDAIMLKKNKPKLVLIEYNRLLANRNSEFDRVISNPLFGSLKEHFKIFRTKNQPIRYIAQLALHIKDKIKHEMNKYFSSFSYTKFNSKRLGVDVMELNTVRSNPDMVSRAIQELNIYLSFLKSNNIKFVLFKMPSVYFENCEMCKELEGLIINGSKNQEYVLLNEFTDKYETTDGAHLSPESSLKVGLHIRNELQESNLLY